MMKRSSLESYVNVCNISYSYIFLFLINQTIINDAIDLNRGLKEKIVELTLATLESLAFDVRRDAHLHVQLCNYNFHRSHEGRFAWIRLIDRQALSSALE